jgi:hypothetical protein
MALLQRDYLVGIFNQSLNPKALPYLLILRDSRRVISWVLAVILVKIRSAGHPNSQLGNRHEVLDEAHPGGLVFDKVARPLMEREPG